jgi:colanic acid/amylovoran/stewartan biosynthesis glycosyltransferase WcaL/AmsK/CpsK
MRIAFIVSQFPVLSETFILDQITGLIDRRHEVDIYAQIPTDDSIAHENVENYKLLERTYYMNTNGSIPKNKMFRLIGGIAHIFTNLHKERGSILKSLNVLKYGREAASLGLLYQVAPFVNRGPYDIIHCQFGPSGNLGLSLRDKGAFKGKIITTFLGFDISQYIKAKGNHVYDKLFTKGNLFLCNSERIKKKLIELGCPDRKIIVHRSGVDTRKFAFVSREPKSDGKIKLLTIARLVEKKGVQYGIRAVAKIQKKHSNIEYYIVGDGMLRNSLERLIEDTKSNGFIKLVGWKREGELIELLRQADILLAPSVTAEDGDQEGIPVVLVDALARGLPVVSTQHSGIPELVQDGVSGFLVPERNVDALAEKLDYLIQHGEAWPEMGRAGRSFVEQHYDINLLNDRLVGIYRRLLAGEIPEPRTGSRLPYRVFSNPLLLRRGVDK